MRYRNGAMPWAVLIFLCWLVIACAPVPTATSTHTPVDTYTPSPQRPTNAVTLTLYPTATPTKTATPSPPLSSAVINADNLDQVVLLENIELDNTTHGNLTSLVFSNDGTYLAATTFDHRSYLWSLPGLQEIVRVQKSNILISKAFAYSEDQILVAEETADGLAIRDMLTNELLYQFEGSVFPFSQMAVSADGHLIAIPTSHYEEVILWDLSTQQEILRLKGDWNWNPWVVPPEWPRTILFSPDNSIVVAPLTDRSIIWNGITGEVIKEIDTEAALFTSDGSYLVASNGKNQISFFDTTSWNQTQIIDAGNVRIQQISFSRDDEILITYASNGKISFWDWALGTTVRTLNVFIVQNLQLNRYGVYTGGSAGLLQMSPDGTLLVSSYGVEGRYLKLWGIP